MRNRSENQITIVLIRHGATESNKEHKYLGKTDESLSREGEEKLLKNKEKNCYPRVEYLFTSPMKRCMETAKLLYPDMRAEIIPEWEEMDFGVFEGKKYQELKEDERYQEWLGSNGTLPFPNGESREEFIGRCVKGFERMLTCQKPMPKTIGMIVHGGTIMALLSRYAGGEYFDYQVSNGEGYRCRLESWKESPKLTETKKL